MSHDSLATNSAPAQPGHAFQRGFIVITVLGLILLTLPLIALMWRAIDSREALATTQTQSVLRDALILSFTTSLIALVVIVVIGVPIAWVLARIPFRGSRVVDALIDLPIILPPAVAGIALLTAFGRNGIIGSYLAQLGITIGYTTTAVVFAQIFVSAPFFIRTARAGFVRVDHTLEEVAADLGATPWRVFSLVTLPLVRASLLAGVVLAWARALGEFGATILFAGNRQGTTQTMSLAIYERFGAGDLPSALVLSAILLATSIIFLVAVRMVGEPPVR